MAVLCGPFGCTLRWLLSKANYKLPGSWNWLPIGTFAANMLGCMIDYFVGVIQLNCPTSHVLTTHHMITLLSLSIQCCQGATGTVRSS